MTVTLSTCWYILKSKFDPSIYQGWIHNMLANVNNYNLVVYCDKFSIGFIEPYLKNRRIKAVIKPMHEFSTYGMRERWIDNHRMNPLLNQKVGWELNMLWCEKLALVQQTIRGRYFDSSLGDVARKGEVFAQQETYGETLVKPYEGNTSMASPSEWYGWCDIGYFRGRPNDSPTQSLANWPNDQAVSSLDPSKIYYACVNNNLQYVQQLYLMVQDRNAMGLPRVPIPDSQISIAGGFFLGTAENLQWWHNTFYSLLFQYFESGRIVKDDQIIVANGVYSNLDRFHLQSEQDPRYDNWFLFQRFLL